MLNRAKLLSQVQAVSDSLFTDLQEEYSIAKKAWNELCADSNFCYKIRTLKSPWLLPGYVGAANDKKIVSAYSRSHCALSVDGSQIYPDRHQGVSCYLINIGTVELYYGMQISPRFNSIPFVYTPEQGDDEFESTTELVNCQRQQLEFEFGLQASQEIQKRYPELPLLFLFDGSLIFWHLESKDPLLKETFLGRYMGMLHQLYQHKILCAGFISLPKSKELVNLIRVQLCNFTIEGCEAHHAVDHIVDSAVASFFLNPHERTGVFASNAKISEYYPDHLKPYFFYLHIGDEIVRIEIPAWIAKDEAKLDVVASIALDQSLKGRGYPVAIAEAHEQAVIKGPDRDFFYHVIAKMGIEQRRRIKQSQKSIKKRGMGI